MLLALVPTLAVAAPRKKRPKKPVVAKQAEPVPATTEPPDPEPGKDAVKSAAAAAPGAPATPAPPAGGGGGAGGGAGSGGGSGDAPAASPPEPAKDPAPKDGAREGKPAVAAVDVDSLRQEYLSLRDELFQSRARASTVESQLYSTRIQIKLTYTTARYYNPAKATIRLDGASVYENAAGGIASDDGVRFDGYVAPGRHLITFRVEATGKDDDSFTSVTESQIVVKAVPGKDLVVAAKARDSGDIAYEWKRKERGSYGLGIDVAVKTQPRAEAGKGAKP
ncbi:MAG: hypothetical protein ACTHU0_15625 [Kofleriaceae bacterium]